jgi:lysophospholipase L1-like esterase
MKRICASMALVMVAHVTQVWALAHAQEPTMLVPLAPVVTAQPQFHFQHSEPPPQSEPAPQINVNTQPLSPRLFNAQALRNVLAALGQPQGKGARKNVRVLQIGDSHTAGDNFTQGWRGAWQAEYGYGGRGMQPVGKPYRGYISYGVTAMQSPEWQVSALFGHNHREDGAPLGVTGFTLSTTHAGARLSLTADDNNNAFDTFTLCGVAGVNSGAVTIAFQYNGEAQTQVLNLATAPDAPATSPASAPSLPRCLSIFSPSLISSVTLTTQDDKLVQLTGWETKRRSGGGVILDNLGVVGSRFIHFARNNDAILTNDLLLTHPDMVVIAFGTNEGFDPGLQLPAAEAAMRSQIVRIRQRLGYAVPILLLGPPDTASNRAAIALPSLSETQACGGGWSVPGNIVRIKALQMRLAQELGLGFWDWQAAMGGVCSSAQWVAQGLQRGDHVHFTKEGGMRLGALLAADLDAARAAMEQSQPPQSLFNQGGGAH